MSDSAFADIRLSNAEDDVATARLHTAKFFTSLNAGAVGVVPVIYAMIDKLHTTGSNASYALVDIIIFVAGIITLIPVFFSHESLYSSRLSVLRGENKPIWWKINKVMWDISGWFVLVSEVFFGGGVVFFIFYVL